MVLWNENMSVIMALDSQNVPLKIREWVKITRMSLCMLENAHFCIEKYMMKGEVRLRLVLRWCFIFWPNFRLAVLIELVLIKKSV